MKHVISMLIAAVILTACGNTTQNQAIAQGAIKPGTTATSTGGYTLTAKINGKEWIAASMMPPDVAGRIIGYRDDEYIGLPYDKRNFQKGKKFLFSESDAADLAINEKGAGMYGGRKGQMEITNVSDSWIEGKFFFTGNTAGSDKTIEVTDGFFRIKR